MSRPIAYALAVALVGVATLGTFAIYPWIEPSISLLFFLAIVIPAIYGYGPAILATALSTASIAYFFVPPRYSLEIGIDDAVRLAVFLAVGVATAFVSAARRFAEDAQRRSVRDLQSAVETLRKVSGWPALIGADAAASVARMLEHAAAVVGARCAIVGWESDEEPWVYLADASMPETVTRYAGVDLPATVAERCGGAPLVSAPFETEHLSGRVFFTDVAETATDLTAAVELVAREVGNSLDQLYLTERLQQVAVREDRLNVARDLHDGVLQALTGIRFQLQAIADENLGPAERHDRLLALERAIATEQRELRLFIDALKPGPSAADAPSAIAPRVEEMCARLSAEWETPIALRVAPPDLALPATTGHTIRLMVHEAIVNALKHAQPSRIDVAIDGADGELRIAVSDDGRGFPFRGRMSHADLVRADVGPASLRGRVAALDGRLSIDSTDHGSRVELTLPLTLTS